MATRFNCLALALLLLSGCASRSIAPWASAANQRDMEAAKALILQENRPLGTDLYGDTPLLWAARNGDGDLVRHLLATTDVDVDQTNLRTGETPLIAAVRQGHRDVVELLLASNADPSVVDLSGNTARDWAAQRGDQQSLARLDPSAAHGDGRTANTLVAAVYSGSLATVQALAALQTINGIDTHGETALIAAAKTGDLEIAGELLRLGADLSIADALGRTPLVLAVQSGHSDLVSRLHDHGAVVAGTQYRGYPLVTFAAANGQPDMIERLVALGGDANWQSADTTALMIAVQKTHLQAAIALLGNGADANARTASGDTALHVAAHTGDAGLVDLLLESGADLAAENVAGYSPLLVAAQRSHRFVALLLVRRGARLNAAQRRLLANDPGTAAPLYEMIAAQLVAGGQNQRAADSLHRAAKAHSQSARRLKRIGLLENIAIGFLTAATVFVESNQHYLSGEAYRARTQAKDQASIRALGDARSHNDYFARRPKYQASYERAARMRELALRPEQREWPGWRDGQTSGFTVAGRAASARSALVSEAARCVSQASAGRAVECMKALR